MEDLINWKKPVVRQASRLGNVMRVHNSKGYKKVVFSADLLKEIGLEGATKAKVMFYLDGKENSILTFSVTPKDKYYYEAVLPTPQAKSMSISNTDLVLDIHKHFAIDSQYKYADFTLTDLGMIGGRHVFGISK